jgi:DNA segregation ATPase FtsK/SpoIIIE-like protein
MFSKVEIKKLQNQVAELSEKIDKVIDKQNAQFTDIMIQVKLTRDEISERNAAAELDYSGDVEGTDDDMYEPARETVIAANRASTSFIQRKLGIGYSRAAKLMDTLEEEGVIGPANGSKPREILVTDSSIQPVEVEDDKDEFYEIVEEYARSIGRISTPAIQRKFAVGYSRAAKLMDMLEVRGIVGVADGAKPRDVLETKGEY